MRWWGDKNENAALKRDKIDLVRGLLQLLQREEAASAAER
jgi:hypothetical protein